MGRIRALWRDSFTWRTLQPGRNYGTLTYVLSAPQRIGTREYRIPNPIWFSVGHLFTQVSSAFEVEVSLLCAVREAYNFSHIIAEEN